MGTRDQVDELHAALIELLPKLPLLQRIAAGALLQRWYDVQMNIITEIEGLKCQLSERRPA